jgi:aspartokinase/homoserine dehydrogenase 1
MKTTNWIEILQQYYSIDFDHLSPNYEPTGQRSEISESVGWNVHKFGGSCFETADSYSFVGSLINGFDGKNLIVVSALNGITNQLYAICHRAKSGDWLHSQEWLGLVDRISRLIKSVLGQSSSGLEEIHCFVGDLFYLINLLSGMSLAFSETSASIEQLVVGYGEIWSARLLTQIMRQDYKKSVSFLDARQVLLVNPQGSHLDICWSKSKERLKNWFQKHQSSDLLIVTGFIARHAETELPITLKRNGSDLSATIFAVLTESHCVTIWKDVDGIYTSDPHKNPSAEFRSELSYEEAKAAARAGDFIIQYDCIEPAQLYDVTILLRNCFKLDCPGTIISPIKL